MTSTLIDRRHATLGSHSPLFYSTPLEIVRGDGVWLDDAEGRRYLDAYNNVPHVGHCHPRVVAAIAKQAATLNLNTRYLNEHVVTYAEKLLALFDDPLDRVFLTNSGSEANELAIRIARQHTGRTGMIVSDWSYHGNTIALAELTTGLTAQEALAPHVRAVRVPDLLAEDAPGEAELVERSLAEVDRAIEELQAEGHGVCATLFDTLFTTEGLVEPPAAYVQGLVDRVRRAGGLVIADEVQPGFGRTGSHWWGYQRWGISPDFVTMGKSMGNGHPVAGVVTTSALQGEFGAANMFFNTFAGNPVSAAAAEAVLDVLVDERLRERAGETGALLRERMEEITAPYARLGPVRGVGLFFGFEIFADDGRTTPDPDTTRAIVEDMRERGVLLSRIGRHDSVFKIRPPMVTERSHAELLLDRIAESLAAQL
ncbi:aspartate aminotransferase family protein [Microbacterium sp. G2-8]|uniref:aspartate aminotransferase family protein n=1 Tax=Microbacterium sp. G2-8 TaxID=2842454 RepID=UPI001C89A97C|nr:aminotransferase class III-fold pyridoxal phosphate-dependent enzyme [Microbacterium sp. G2-8]